MKNIFILSIILLPFCLSAQEIPPNKYGLKVVNSPELYRQLVAKDSNMQMVDAMQFIPGLKMDVRYATAQNFTHQQLYPQARVFLRLPAAKALLQVQQALAQKGLGLMVYDGYRPYTITEKMWALVPDDRYAADPSRGSGHNRGAAVDLTIISLKTGKTLHMPTDFDNFTEMAHHNYPLTDSAVAANRKLLKSVMEQYGFTALDTEWWHYFLKNHKDYPLMDISFGELDKR